MLFYWLFCYLRQTLRLKNKVLIFPTGCRKPKSILNRSSFNFFWLLGMKACYLILIVFLFNLVLILSNTYAVKTNLLWEFGLAEFQKTLAELTRYNNMQYHNPSYEGYKKLKINVMIKVKPNWTQILLSSNCKLSLPISKNKPLKTASI